MDAAGARDAISTTTTTTTTHESCAAERVEAVDHRRITSGHILHLLDVTALGGLNKQVGGARLLHEWSL